LPEDGGQLQMSAQFQMSDLGLLCLYLGIEVQQGRDGIKLKQAAYASKILERAGMGNCNPCHTPMEHRLKLSKNSTAPPVNTTEYRGLVGCLRYLVHTRPDITFVVGYVSRFMERPTTEHLNAVKRILRYTAITSAAAASSRCWGTATLIWEVTSTPGRVPRASCSSTARVLSPGNRRSRRWSPSHPARPSTLQEPRQLAKEFGWRNFCPS
jgi:hypothetical protein